MTTTESLFEGRLTCRQPLRGYRFSVDAVLLAHFFKPDPCGKIIDLGTGCGIMALILAYRYPSVAIIGLEIQADLAKLARRNVAGNSYEDRVDIVEGDLCLVERLFASGSFRRVIANPPYYPAGRARSNPDPDKAVARHEIMATLQDVVAASSWLLEEEGRVDLVYPAVREVELLETLKANNLKPSRLQKVFPFPGGSQKLVLVEAVKGGSSGLEFLADFYIQRSSEGEDTREMARFYEP